MTEARPDGTAEDAGRTTLVGVATGTPDGGVAIVRLSGPRAETIAISLAGSLGPARALVRRRLALGGGQTEDALVVRMPGPGSLTGEDVVELHVHAGARNVRTVVQACLDAGATAAGAGDFTRRAFERGRLSLDEAEGIAAIIAAQTDAALAQARRLADGELGRAVDALRSALLDLRTEVEANLDFPEDVEDGDVRRWGDAIEAHRARLAAWLRGFEAGRRIREQPRVVLAGPVNAGKSSLFNALLERPRALVSDRPGTTRDYVEASIDLGPHACVLVDTAGLREGEDAVEAAGIALSRDQIGSADVVLWVESADTPPGRAPSFDAHVIAVETKRDLGCRRSEWVGACCTGPTANVDAVRAALRRWLEANAAEAWIGLARHRDRAREAHAALVRAAEHLHADRGLELVAFELATAERRIGEIRGHTALGPIGQDVLDRIFSTFCIGK